MLTDQSHALYHATGHEGMGGGEEQVRVRDRETDRRAGEDAERDGGSDGQQALAGTRDRRLQETPRGGREQVRVPWFRLILDSFRLLLNNSIQGCHDVWVVRRWFINLVARVLFPVESQA